MRQWQWRMFSIEIECGPHDRDLLIADLWEQGCAGITEIDDRRMRVFFEDGADCGLLADRYPGAIIRAEEDRDWVRTARDLLQPMLIGTRWFLVPEWRSDPTPPGRFRIEVNPGMAFGTGVHETTQLCLEALEDYVQPGIAVLDIGTGSGILGQAAALLGARHVYACDTDPAALEIAGQRLPAGFIGSADAVRAGIADLVVANISPEAIVELAPDLWRTLRPGGVLLASGFESQELKQVKAALENCEFRQKGRWMLAIALKAA
jgi:ribosomal protein L11 methyltransferase